MGACNFIEFAQAKTAREAFNHLVFEAEYEHGHDHYNGTISTCTMDIRHEPKVAQKRYTKNAINKAYDIAEKDGWGEKYVARIIDCGLVPYKRGVHTWAFYGWAAC